MFWLWIAFIWGACVGSLVTQAFIRRDIKKFKLGRKG